MGGVHYGYYNYTHNDCTINRPVEFDYELLKRYIHTPQVTVYTKFMTVQLSIGTKNSGHCSPGHNDIHSLFVLTVAYLNNHLNSK